MATFAKTARFVRDQKKLTAENQAALKQAVKEFCEDLPTGSFRPSLRVKGVQGAPRVFEMTFAPDGRATWEYGEPIKRGVPHVIWRRVGTHDIFGSP